MAAFNKYLSLVSFSITFLLPSLLFGQKDHFKAYLKAPSHEIPTRLQGNKIQLGNNGKDLYIVGELKEASPNYGNQAFVLHADAEGAIVETFSLKSNSQSATDGVRGSSLSIDSEGAMYVGGSYTGNWDPLSMGAERSLIKLDVGGKQEWGAMQPNLYFSDLTFYEAKNHIIAMSGPTSLLNPNYDIHFNEFSTDGKIISTFALQTSSVDYGKALANTPSGIAFTGTSYDTGIPKALIGLVDADLNLSWAFALSNTDFELEVQDMAYHTEGIIGITGTAQDIKNGITQAFLIGVGLDGEVYYFQTFQVGVETEGLGIEAYTYGEDKGFLMAGFYHTGKAEERKSMILKTEVEGNLLWANSYSPYKPEDNTYDEVLRDVIYLESEGLFAAIGDLRRYKNGQSINRKTLILVKGGIQDGKLNLGEECYQTLDLETFSRSLSKQSIGVGNRKTETFISLSYQQPSLEFNTGYCSFGPARKAEPETPSRISGIEGINRDSEQFLLYKTGIQNLRIEYREKLFDSLVFVEVFDLRGQLVSKIQLSPDRQSWDIQLPVLSYGMYFVKISAQNLPLKVDRFIMGQ